MPVTRDMLVSELQTLLRLTAFEQTIATIRRTQARTDALEKELAENARKAGERVALISEAIRKAGGVPDVVGSALGKVGAFTTTQLNQVQTLQGALLGDLTLEHQLRERTRYARTLAQSLNDNQVLPVLDRLEVAHSATIDWLEQRLDEVARTGTSLLRATPLQAAVSSVRHVAAAPLEAVASTVNQASNVLSRFAKRNTPKPVLEALGRAQQRSEQLVDRGVHEAREAVQRGEDKAAAAVTGAESLGADLKEAAGSVGKQVKDTARDTAEQAKDTVEQAKDTAEQAKDTARDTVEQAKDTAEHTVAELAEEARAAAEQVEQVDLTGTGDVAHPFAGYEKLTGDRVMAHVRDTEDVAELQQILAFENAHKARKGVLAAVQERLTELSASV